MCRYHLGLKFTNSSKPTPTDLQLRVNKCGNGRLRTDEVLLPPALIHQHSVGISQQGPSTCLHTNGAEAAQLQDKEWPFFFFFFSKKIGKVLPFYPLRHEK